MSDVRGKKRNRNIHSGKETLEKKETSNLQLPFWTLEISFVDTQSNTGVHVLRNTELQTTAGCNTCEH